MARRKVKGITIEKLAQGGEGLGFLPDGRVIFVEGGLPGDRVEVEVRKEKKSWARGAVHRIEEASPKRIAARCEAFQRGCGGCTFWGTDYESELQWKVQAAREAMERISSLDLPEPQIVGASTVDDYRTRVTFHQRRVGQEVRRGFYASGSRKVVEVQRCLIADKAIDEAMEEFGGFLLLLGAADITVETAGEGRVVILVELAKGERIRHQTLEECRRGVERGGVVQGLEIDDGRGKYFIIGDTTVSASQVLAEPPADSLRMKAGLFRQSNRGLNRSLVAHVVEAATQREERPHILELYCGSGNFSFPLARKAASLVGVEGSQEAVEAARQLANAVEGLSDVEFRVGDLSDAEVVEGLLSEPFDVLVLDPPREGAAEVARQLARGEGGGQVVYISCDVACLARDLKRMSEGGWEVEAWTIFDMFPRTAHLEAVAILSR